MKRSITPSVEAGVLPAREWEAAWRPLRQQGTKLGSNLGTALESVWSNRLRSLLTTLGIVIGIAAVIAVVTLSQGVNAFFTAQFSQLGTTVLTVQPGPSGRSGPQSQGPSLSTADVLSLAKLQHVLGVSPIVPSGGEIVSGNTNWTTSIDGVSSAYQVMDTWSLSEGRWWNQSDEQLGLPVIILGQTVVQNTFGMTGVDPMGHIVRWNDQPYRVIGVLASREALNAQDQNDIAFVPYTNLVQTGAIPLDTIQVQADSVNDVNLVQQEVALDLERTHPPSADGRSAFTVNTPQQLIDQENRSNAALEDLLVGLAAITLTVGGIGIMNMMIVSVTERTREIGLRVAVGAQPSDIRNQFLVESLILCVSGGGVAVPFGLSVGYLLTAQFGFPYVPNLLALLIALGVAACVGLGFGFYPAVRAARLDPIVALRSE